MLRLKIGLIIIVSFHSVFGQQVNTSPFSRYGVGEINNVIAAIKWTKIKTDVIGNTISFIFALDGSG